MTSLFKWDDTHVRRQHCSKCKCHKLRHDFGEAVSISTYGFRRKLTEVSKPEMNPFIPFRLMLLATCHSRVPWLVVGRSRAFGSQFWLCWPLWAGLPQTLWSMEPHIAAVPSGLPLQVKRGGVDVVVSMVSWKIVSKRTCKLMPCPCWRTMTHTRHPYLWESFEMVVYWRCITCPSMLGSLT